MLSAVLSAARRQGDGLQRPGGQSSLNGALGSSEDEQLRPEDEGPYPLKTKGFASDDAVRPTEIRQQRSAMSPRSGPSKWAPKMWKPLTA